MFLGRKVLAAGHATGFLRLARLQLKRSETGFQRPRVEPVETFFLPKRLLCMSKVISCSKLTNDQIDQWRWYGDGGQVLTTPKSLTDIGIEDRFMLLPHGVRWNTFRSSTALTYFHIRRCGCLSIFSSSSFVFSVERISSRTFRTSPSFELLCTHRRILWATGGCVGHTDGWTWSISVSGQLRWPRRRQENEPSSI